MKVKVGISNRHVHLTKEDFYLLFGDVSLTKRNDLSQVGEYASDQVVTLVGTKNSISNVRIIGPFRSYTQVEVSKTDCYTLGIDCPIRASGNLDNASEITIRNGDKEIKRNCAIIPERHIHLSKKEKEELGLSGEKYKVKTFGEKSGILDNVYLKVGDNYSLELHIDTDDANAHLLRQNDEVELLKFNVETYRMNDSLIDIDILESDEKESNFYE